MPKTASPTNSAPATARAKIITFADFFFDEEGGLGPTVVVVVSLMGSSLRGIACRPRARSRGNGVLEFWCNVCVSHLKISFLPTRRRVRLHNPRCHAVR